MTTRPRRSPKLPEKFDNADVRRAVSTLEDMPRVPEKAVATVNDDGYEGEIVTDNGYLKVYRNGSWKRALLSDW